MATKKNKLLTWHGNHNRPGGRWRKYVDGKVRYFGHGSSPDDVRSYREAERKYIEFLKKLEDVQPVDIYYDSFLLLAILRVNPIR